MSRTPQERARDVRRLVAAAASLARDPGLVDRLVETTGLSREGVALALAEHLETSPADADVDHLVSVAGDAPHVHVLLASNVFVAALRAIACARATASRVTVAPSRREPTFARALVERAGDPGLSLDDLDVGSLRAGEIHVYGRDETVRDVQARAAASVKVLGHGAGMGVAWVQGDVAAAAEAIARDVVPFDQRGCLSPRVVLVPEARAALALCEALDGRLAVWEARVPRGARGPEEAAEARRYAETLAFAGRLWRGRAHAIGLAATGAPLLVPPPGRHVHVVVARGLDEARAILAPIAGLVVAIGADDPRAAKELAPRARVSALGAMQRPALDGPVDLRPFRPADP